MLTFDPHMVLLITAAAVVTYIVHSFVEPRTQARDVGNEVLVWRALFGVAKDIAKDLGFDQEPKNDAHPTESEIDGSTACRYIDDVYRGIC